MIPLRASTHRGPTPRHWGGAALWFALTALFTSPLPSFPALGQVSEGAPEEPIARWALLIGAQDYENFVPLTCSNNDVIQLAATLRERGGLRDDEVLELSDDRENRELRPLRVPLMKQIERWLARPAQADQVIVYFSGHGGRDKRGTLYLCTTDTDPERLAETAVSAEWLQERLKACKAAAKLLVLDVCHAGADQRSPPAGAVDGNALGERFAQLEGAVTLASCSADESSLEWPQRQQGLFSFWLNQALRGHADRDNDGRIKTDELYDYLHRNVRRSAERIYACQQTPVQIVGGDVRGVQTVLELRPRKLDSLLADMADQLSWAIADRQLERVGVAPEFIVDSPLDKELGGKWGLLGKRCAAQLEERLLRAGQNGPASFSVVDNQRLVRAMRASAFKINDLYEPEALKKVAADVQGLPAIAIGMLRGREGDRANLRCRLEDAGGGDVLADVGGLALLSVNDWAELGKSAVVPAPPGGGAPDYEGGVAPPAVPDLDKEAEGANPLANSDFAYPVRIYVAGELRKGVLRGNDYLVPVRKGEELAVHVWNNSPEPVYMRLLVDGLNTLPQKDFSQGVETLAVAPRVSLERARHWILDPQRKYVVGGFVTATGSQGKMRTFEVVDAVDSEAARQEFTEQIGLITAAFYLPVRPPPMRMAMGSIMSSAPELGIRLGPEVTAALPVRRAPPIGDFVAVVHIRYVNADTFSGR